MRVQQAALRFSSQNINNAPVFDVVIILVCFKVYLPTLLRQLCAVAARRFIRHSLPGLTLFVGSCRYSAYKRSSAIEKCRLFQQFTGRGHVMSMQPALLSSSVPYCFQYSMKPSSIRIICPYASFAGFPLHCRKVSSWWVTLR